MPDTGAPWNIPYVENADLVRDWPADSLLVANAVAAGLTAAGNAGIGSNVVQTVKTDTFSATSASFTAITGLSVTITPTSATSKVFVLFDVQMFVGNGRAQGVRLMRDATAIGIGDAASSRPRSSAATALGTITSAADRNQWSVTRAILDSPGTASAVTYSVDIYSNTGTLFVNRSAEDGDSTLGPRSVSTITAIEVAA